MFKYHARNPESLKAITRIFLDSEEAREFAVLNSTEYPEYEIIPTFINGIADESENTEEAYDEETELRMMGLDEESEDGFDWTLEDK